MTETILRPTSDVEKGWDYSTGGGSGTLHLVIDALDATWTQWDEIGTNPYLHNTQTTDRIETIATGNQHGWFTYTNSGKSAEDITFVKIIITVYGDGNDAVHVYLHDGVSEHDLGSLTGDPETWTDEVIDVTSILNTWAKIDAAKIRLVKETAGKKDYFKVCYSELWIDWTLARTDYTEVDEDPHDSDTTYIKTSTTEAVWEDDLFGFETFDLPAGEQIDSVKVYGVVRSENNTYRLNFGFLVKPNAKKYVQYTSAPPNTYTSYNKEWTTNPETGNPWTEAEINALAAGVRGKSYQQCILGCTVYFFYPGRCTQVYLGIVHSPTVVPAKIQYSDGLVCVSVG